MKNFIKNKVRRYLTESEKKTVQELNLSDTTFYHGTTYKIDSLDPTFRQSNRKAMGNKSSGSANNGVGIYFSRQLGWDEENPTYASIENGGGVIMTDSGENALKWTKSADDVDGYIYMMKLESDANIVDESFNPPNNPDFSFNHRNILMDTYNILRENGVDAVWGGHELVLLNQDAVQEFKLYYKLTTKYRVSEMRMGKLVDGKTLNKEEVEPYLKEMLGDGYSKRPWKRHTMYMNDDIGLVVIPIKGQPVKH